MPHTHINSQRCPNSLLLWPAFGAGTQQWLCPSQPQPPWPCSRCDLGRGSASLLAPCPQHGHLQAHFIVSSSPRRARESCAGLLELPGNRGSHLQPCPYRREPSSSSPEARACPEHHRPAQCTCSPPPQRDSWAPLLLWVPSKAWSWALQQNFYLCGVRSTKGHSGAAGRSGEIAAQQLSHACGRRNAASKSPE